jgi:CRP-like cAMP-binding protein/uncharacterized protein (DUF2225 family)
MRIIDLNSIQQHHLFSLEKEFERGVYLFKQGDDSKDMYILIDGKISVRIDGMEVALIEEEGSYFGEMSALLGVPRTASIKTMTICKFICVSHEKMDSFLASSPKVSLKLTRIMADRLKNTTAELGEIGHITSAGQKVLKKLYVRMTELENEHKGTKKLLKEFARPVRKYHRKIKSALEHITQKSAHLNVYKGKSTYAKDFACFFHESRKKFTCLLLKEKSQVMKTNLFDVFVYQAGSVSYEHCNYLLLEIQVCPVCYFASNHYPHFLDIEKDHGRPNDFSEKVIELMPQRFAEREKMAKSFSRDFYTLRRTPKDAVKAFELAALCAITISDAHRNPHALSLCRAGNYYLKAAHLSKEINKNTQEDDFLKLAMKYFEIAFPTLRGSNLYRTAYQLVTLNIYFGQFNKASNYYEALSRIEREGGVINSDNESKYFNKYLVKAQNHWEDRKELTREKIEKYGEW